jgi:hypothetical protein
MKKYLVCQTIDYMQMSYDYEYKELSIPFTFEFTSPNQIPGIYFI